MADCCSGAYASDKPPVDPTCHRIFGIALVVNAGMFGIGLFVGWTAGSLSLLADAANYAVSLFVPGLAPIWRSHTALIKGLTIGSYGIFVVAAAFWSALTETMPARITIGTIGLDALFANLRALSLLFICRNRKTHLAGGHTVSTRPTLTFLLIFLKFPI